MLWLMTFAATQSPRLQPSLISRIWLLLTRPEKVEKDVIALLKARLGTMRHALSQLQDGQLLEELQGLEGALGEYLETTAHDPVRVRTLKHVLLPDLSQLAFSTQQFVEVYRKCWDPEIRVEQVAALNAVTRRLKTRKLMENGLLHGAPPDTSLKSMIQYHSG